MVSVREIRSHECVALFVAALRTETPHSRPVTLKAIAEALRTWTLVGIFSFDDELIGVIGCDARGETHVHVTPAWRHRWQARSTILQAFRLLLGRHATLHVAIPRENTAAMKIAKLIGAHRTAEDAQYISYELHASESSLTEA